MTIAEDGVLFEMLCEKIRLSKDAKKLTEYQIQRRAGRLGMMMILCFGFSQPFPVSVADLCGQMAEEIEMRMKMNENLPKFVVDPQKDISTLRELSGIR